MPVSPEFHDGRFFTRIDGRRAATLMLVTLVAIEATDLVFAVDSVAAILAITTSTFIVWTANALAVLGLRALYFCLAGLLERFVLLHYGLAFLLAFAGVKLILSETPVGKIPVWITLPVIAATLLVSIVASLAVTRGGATGPSHPVGGERRPGGPPAGHLGGGEGARRPEEQQDRGHDEVDGQLVEPLDRREGDADVLEHPPEVLGGGRLGEDAAGLVGERRERLGGAELVRPAGVVPEQDGVDGDPQLGGATGRVER
jgi:hypothetical protein